MQLIKNRVKEYRTERGLSLEDVSKYSGISVDDLEQIEMGKEMHVNTMRIARMAELLNAKPSEIFLDYMEDVDAINIELIEVYKGLIGVKEICRVVANHEGLSEPPVNMDAVLTAIGHVANLYAEVIYPFADKELRHNEACC